MLILIDNLKEEMLKQPKADVAKLNADVAKMKQQVQEQIDDALDPNKDYKACGPECPGEDCCPRKKSAGEQLHADWKDSSGKRSHEEYKVTKAEFVANVQKLITSKASKYMT